MTFARIVLASFFAAAPVLVVDIRPAVQTETTGHDADDPAVWIHPKDASRSLILGTNKVAAPNGALVVFGMDGKVRQRIGGIDRPNNVDIEGDLAVLTERLKSRLRLFRVSETGVTESGTVPVFEGQTGEAAAPMGIALYKRGRDKAVFAIVGRKTGPTQGYLWQYRIEGTRATKVREFGSYSGSGEIEAIAVDDENGFVYYADEECCIRKWHADPDHPKAAIEVATFGREGFTANREGIAVHKDYIVCTDQIAGGSQYRLYRRKGDQAAPVAVLRGTADSTDGLEVVSRPMGPQFPRGFLIAMNSSGKNFLLFPWPEMRR
ncbi:MAG TPA: phytase [Bryobacteraceae bacterium]|nr:phytase [Bryobacteraceae bacterium]